MTQEKNSMLRKYYEVWEGKNLLFCRGKLMLGTSVRSVLFSWLLLNVPSLLEEIFVISKYNGTTFIGILIGYIINQVLANFYLFKTISTDPGIIKRNNSLYTDSEELRAIPVRKTKYRRRIGESTVNHFITRIKFCETCHVYRPPRTSHCHDCDNCVERFDHHCPWLGVCIGKRNYRKFVAFTSYCCLLSAFTLAISFHRIFSASQNPHRGHIFSGEPYTIISIVICILLSLFIWPLLVFHCWLMLTNTTTYEFWKKSWRALGMNPYDKKSQLNNCRTILTLPIRGSFLKLREFAYPHETKFERSYSTQDPNFFTPKQTDAEKRAFHKQISEDGSKSEQTNSPGTTGTLIKEERQYMLSPQLQATSPVEIVPLKFNVETLEGRKDSIKLNKVMTERPTDSIRKVLSEISQQDIVIASAQHP